MNFRFSTDFQVQPKMFVVDKRTADARIKISSSPIAEISPPARTRSCFSSSVSPQSFLSNWCQKPTILWAQEPNLSTLLLWIGDKEFTFFAFDVCFIDVCFIDCFLAAHRNLIQCPTVYCSINGRCFFGQSITSDSGSLGCRPCKPSEQVCKVSWAAGKWILFSQSFVLFCFSFLGAVCKKLAIFAVFGKEKVLVVWPIILKCFRRIQ